MEPAEAQGSLHGSPALSELMFSESIEARFRELVSIYPQKRSVLIPMLILAQREQGWVTPEAITYVADYLGLSSSDVESVASFYTMLNLRPVGRHMILVCTNIACMLCGSDRIEAALKDRLGIGMGETTADGEFTLMEAECLGSCTTAPVLQVNGEFHENLDPGRVEALLDDIRAKSTP
jgi:NADH-quinone oxidoreductase E subunit